MNKIGLKITDKEKWKRDCEKCSGQIADGLRKDGWVFQKLAMEGMRNKFEPGTSFLENSAKFTGTCFPGGVRLFVDVDGRFHICEKMHGDFSIGNIEDGFDYNAIKDMMKQWNAQILKRKCWKCSVWYFCSFCFARNIVKNKLVISENACRGLRVSIKKRMRNYLTLLEVIDDKENNCINDLDSFMRSL